MDATHLCEFHQVEGKYINCEYNLLFHHCLLYLSLGMVVDRNLNLGNLIGTIKTFFEKIGITQLRFKPAYNPYTEPSMEIFGYHPDLKKWTGKNLHVNFFILIHYAFLFFNSLFIN